MAKLLGRAAPLMIAHLSAPNLRGQRMDTGRTKHKFLASDSPGTLARKLQQSDPDVVGYYAGWSRLLPGEGSALDRAVSVLSELAHLFQERRTGVVG